MSHRHLGKISTVYSACPLYRHITRITSLEETPHFIYFDHRASFPVDIILRIPYIVGSGTRLGCSRRTVENLQLAYEIASRNLQERTDKQAESKEIVSFPHSQPGYQVLIHRPCTVADGLNPKLF